MIRNVLELGVFDDIINKQWHYLYEDISYKLCFTYSHIQSYIFPGIQDLILEVLETLSTNGLQNELRILSTLHYYDHKP